MNFHLCRHCATGLVITPDGPRHRDGSEYWQKCIHCGWKGGKEEGYLDCPDCHALYLIEDHVASI